MDLSLNNRTTIFILSKKHKSIICLEFDRPGPCGHARRGPGIYRPGPRRIPAGYPQGLFVGSGTYPRDPRSIPAIYPQPPELSPQGFGKPSFQSMSAGKNIGVSANRFSNPCPQCLRDGKIVVLRVKILGVPQTDFLIHARNVRGREKSWCCG